MGADTRGLVSGNLKLLYKALDKLSKKKGYTYNFGDNAGSSSGFFISIKPINRGLFVYPISDLSEYKNKLPKNSRKMKNSKTGILLSLGKNEQAQEFMVDLVKCHDNFGYVMLDDCGYGNFIEVDSNGLVMNNLRKKQHPQIKAMRRYFNDLPQEIPEISLDVVNSLNVDNINKIYVSINPQITEGSTKSTKFLSDYYVLSKDFDLPQKVKENELWGVVGGNHIVSSVVAFDLLNKLPKNKIVNTYGKDMSDIFPL